jgi:hypothetical protein
VFLQPIVCWNTGIFTKDRILLTDNS